MIEALIIYSGYFVGKWFAKMAPTEVPKFQVNYVWIFFVLFPFLYFLESSYVMASILLLATLTFGILKSSWKDTVIAIPIIIILSFI